MKLGIEYGAVRWGTAENMKPYVDKNFYNNIILSQTELLTMNPKMKVFEYNRNKNILVYGGSGSGKTYGVVKPNLMQLNATYILTDPKGTLLPETGNLFKKTGYRIRVLDTKNFSNYMHYNPFAYIRKEEDVMTLAKVLYENLKGADAPPPPDPMWDNGTVLCLSAFIAYLWLEAPPEEQNVGTMMEMFSSCEIREDEPDYKNALDMLFSELEEKNPDSFSVRQWKAFQIAAGKTSKSILITIGANLSPFNMQAVRELMSMDELSVMDGGKCILQLRGVRPFFSEKYDITKHPKYQYLSDFDKKNAFDIEKFLSTKLKLKANEVYEVFDMSKEDETTEPKPTEVQ